MQWLLFSQGILQQYYYYVKSTIISTCCYFISSHRHYDVYFRNMETCLFYIELVTVLCPRNSFKKYIFDAENILFQILRIMKYFDICRYNSKYHQQMTSTPWAMCWPWAKKELMPYTAFALCTLKYRWEISKGWKYEITANITIFSISIRV